MPSISGYHDGRAAIFSVAILDAAAYQEHKTLNDGTAFKGTKFFKALVDTGASITMISPRVVHALGLEQTGRIPVRGLGGTSSRPAYLFHIAFNSTPASGQNDTFKLQVYAKAINGGELSDEHTFDVLLGMDVLYQPPRCLTRGGFPKSSAYDSLSACGRFAAEEG
jgi:Aspartyl protease